MDEILNLYLSGLSNRQVAAKLGISVSKVARTVKNSGVSRKTRIDPDIESNILNLYNSGISSEKLAVQFNLSPTTICRVIKRLGGSIKPLEESHRKYTIKSNYFSNIDSDSKAYILGFLFADGSVHYKTNTVKVEVHVKDVDILHNIIQEIFVTPPKIGTDRKVYKYITITHSKIKQELINLGCIPNKTNNISLPKLPDNLIGSFLRGLYDGDGCISISNRVRVNLTGYSQFLLEIKNLLKSLNIASSFSFMKNSGSLTVSAQEDVIRILNLMYNNSTMHLNRKYKTYLNAIDYLNKPYDKKVFIYNDEKITASKLKTLTIEDKRTIAKEAFNYFRDNGFPYPSYNEHDRMLDFNNLKNSECKVVDGKILQASMDGLKIFRHYSPHFYKVKNKTMPSMIDAFNDDQKLIQVIQNRMGITYKECFNLTGAMIRQGFKNSRLGFAASVFKPSIAKLIYDKYCPLNGRVLDISIGFGQRLLGAAASRNVAHYTGLDPWLTTVESVRKISDEIGFNAKIINVGSENFITEDKFDLCFSSPPFHDKEIYSNDSSQAYYNKDFENFICDWWIPTANNVYNCLNDNALFCLNMNEGMAKSMFEAFDKFKVIDLLEINFERSHMKESAKDFIYILKKM